MDDSEPLDPITDAIVARDHTRLRQLLNRGLDPNIDYDGTRPLHFAAAEGDPTSVELLLSAGAKSDLLDDGGLTAWHWACYSENAPAVIRTLAAHPGDPNRPNSTGETALDCSILDRDDRDVIIALVNAGGRCRRQLSPILDGILQNRGPQR